MAGRTDISLLKGTLLEQRSLLQKLQYELDAEREAAATSASEALSMILRLQGEKAELTLEASQYKRMAEEKLCHVEISLAIFEDLIYQKEMEISSLDHQVQAFRCKLLSFGCPDAFRNSNEAGNVFECECGFQTLSPVSISGLIPVEKVVIEEDFDRSTHSGCCDVVWQGNDAFDDSNEAKNAFECECRFQTPSPVSISDSVTVEKVVIEENLDSSRKGFQICESSCQDLNEQIKKLDERVKEITKFADCLTNNDEVFGEMSESVAETRENLASSSKILDVFEVPHTNMNVNVNEDEERSKKPRKNAKTGRRKCSGLASSKKSRGSVSSDKHKDELQNLKARMERLECENNHSKREITRKNREEDLKLLREIKEQLNCVQSDMRSLRSLKKSPCCPNDSAIVSIKEAMVYFWF